MNDDTFTFSQQFELNEEFRQVHMMKVLLSLYLCYQLYEEAMDVSSIYLHSDKVSCSSCIAYEWSIMVCFQSTYCVCYYSLST